MKSIMRAVLFILFMPCIIIGNAYAGGLTLDDAKGRIYCTIFKHGNDEARSDIVLFIEEFTRKRTGVLSKQFVFDALGVPDIDKNNTFYYYDAKNIRGRDDCYIKFDFDNNAVLTGVASAGTIASVEPYKSPGIDAAFAAACLAFKLQKGTDRYANACVIHQYAISITHNFSSDQIVAMLGTPDLQTPNRINYVALKDTACVVYLEFLLQKEATIYRVNLNTIPPELYDTLFMNGPRPPGPISF